MKSNLFKSLAFLLVAGLAFACGAKKEDDHGHDHAEADETEWKQMDEFHMVMAETFHPFKDSANLEPVKARATELATSAETWAKAELPEKVDNDDMKAKLERLRTETSTLTSTVSTGDDKAIGDQLTKVHDLFHEIQETWYGEKHESH
jgi:hypothetical protein